MTDPPLAAPSVAGASEAGVPAASAALAAAAGTPSPTATAAAAVIPISLRRTDPPDLIAPGALCTLSPSVARHQCRNMGKPLFTHVGYGGTEMSDRLEARATLRRS